jgi:hypothetical protein
MAKKAKQEVEYFTPKISAGYMIEEILVGKENHRGWWIVWYNHETMESAGMESFPSFDKASEWNEKNAPRKIKEGDFNRSTIIFAGY